MIEVVELRIGVGDGRLVVLPQENCRGDFTLLDEVREKIEYTQIPLELSSALLGTQLQVKKITF